MITIRHRYTGAILHQFDRENFDNALLCDGDFSHADMSHMVLSECDLSGAYFFGADLRGAVFSNTNLSGANFSGADMAGVQIKWCILDRANFGDTCLTVSGRVADKPATVGKEKGNA